MSVLEGKADFPLAPPGLLSFDPNANSEFPLRQQVDEKSRKIFLDFVLPGSRPKGIL